MHLPSKRSQIESAETRARAPRSSWGHAALALGCALALASLLPAPARAQSIKPWTPPAADTSVAWAAEARTLFQSVQGDSASGPNHKPYETVGRIARRLVRSLGKQGISQAPAIQPVLDSLGLDTEVAVDPETPGFALVMVRNPYRLTADAVGFLLWYRESDLRVQGVVFSAGHAPKLRVWWTSKPRAPYACGVLSRGRGEDRPLTLLLLRLNPDGYYWNLVQYEGYSPDLGHEGQALWTEINGDAVPEIVSWSRTRPDTSFQECTGCPGLLTERTFVERESGFELQDSRLLPSPYATFFLFVNLLRDHNRAGASRLVQDPALVDRAIALGWGAPKGNWKLEYVEQDQPWPRWIAMRQASAKSAPLYAVHFVMRDGRWILSRWTPITTPGAAAPPAKGAGK